VGSIVYLPSPKQIKIEPLNAAACFRCVVPFLFVDCCIAATAAAFVANGPSRAPRLAGCHVASRHADASRSPAPPPLVATPPFVAPLSSLSSWLSCRLSSRRHLPSKFEMSLSRRIHSNLCLRISIRSRENSPSMMGPHRSCLAIPRRACFFRESCGGGGGSGGRRKQVVLRQIDLVFPFDEFLDHRSPGEKHSPSKDDFERHHFVFLVFFCP
jgi:hypothetical protein